MSKRNYTPDCFNDFRKGIDAAERCCHDCPMLDDCKETAAIKKKPLEPEWVEWCIDIIIGPSLIILGMKAPDEATKLRKLLTEAINALYDSGHWKYGSNEWVVAASDRLQDLYNTYMTAKLIHFFENGVPSKSRIVSRFN